MTNGVITIGSLSKGVSDFPKLVDIKVEHGTRVVVISRPNTGGKTASMKTLGLAFLMLKAGMYLPAKNHSRFPWFDLVLADISDHQVVVHLVILDKILVFLSLVVPFCSDSDSFH